MQSFNRIWTWLKWPCALALLGFLFYQNRDGLNRVASEPKHWGYLTAALLMTGGATLLTFVRWYLLVWAQDIPFRVRDAVRLGFLGLLFNYVAPGSVGGDIFKAIFLAREQQSRRSVAVATVGLDRLLGLLGLFILGASATLFFSTSTELTLVRDLLWIGSACGLLGMIVLLHPTMMRWTGVAHLQRLPYVGGTIAELLHGVLLYQSRPRVVILATALSVVSHGGLIAGFYFGAVALQQWAPSFGNHLFFMPIAELFGVLIPLPGGIGALEGAIQEFYVQLGAGVISAPQAREAGFIAAIIFRLITVCIAGIGTVYYFASRMEIRAALKSAAPERSPGSLVNSPEGMIATR